MNKAQVYQSFLSELENAYKNAVSAAKQAHDSATHSESIAENKYDTFGLESAYLAHGQSQRVMQYQSELQAFRNMKLPEFTRDSAITLGAIVTIQDQNSVEKAVFLGPTGGHTIIESGKSISLISITSPLGSKLMGCHEGDSISIAIGNSQKQYEVLSVI